LVFCFFAVNQTKAPTPTTTTTTTTTPATPTPTTTKQKKKNQIKNERVRASHRVMSLNTHENVAVVRPVIDDTDAAGLVRDVAERMYRGADLASLFDVDIGTLRSWVPTRSKAHRLAGKRAKQHTKVAEWLVSEAELLELVRQRQGSVPTIPRKALHWLIDELGAAKSGAARRALEAERARDTVATHGELQLSRAYTVLLHGSPCVYVLRIRSVDQDGRLLVKVGSTTHNLKERLQDARSRYARLSSPASSLVVLYACPVKWGDPVTVEHDVHREMALQRASYRYHHHGQTIEATELFWINGQSGLEALELLIGAKAGDEAKVYQEKCGLAFLQSQNTLLRQQIQDASLPHHCPTAVHSSGTTAPQHGWSSLDVLAAAASASMELERPGIGASQSSEGSNMATAIHAQPLMLTRMSQTKSIDAANGLPPPPQQLQQQQVHSLPLSLASPHGPAIQKVCMLFGPRIVCTYPNIQCAIQAIMAEKARTGSISEKACMISLRTAINGHSRFAEHRWLSVPVGDPVGTLGVVPATTSYRASPFHSFVGKVSTVSGTVLSVFVDMDAAAEDAQVKRAYLEDRMAKGEGSAWMSRKHVAYTRWEHIPSMARKTYTKSQGLPCVEKEATIVYQHNSGFHQGSESGMDAGEGESEVEIEVSAGPSRPNSAVWREAMEKVYVGTALGGAEYLGISNSRDVMQCIQKKGKKIKVGSKEYSMVAMQSVVQSRIGTSSC
jgi:hypothetical protein